MNLIQPDIFNPIRLLLKDWTQKTGRNDRGGKEGVGKGKLGDEKEKNKTSEE